MSRRSRDLRVRLIRGRGLRRAGAAWGWSSPLTGSGAQDCLEHWRGRLGLQVAVRLERVSPFQVTGENGRPGCSLVGVVLAESPPVIYHTRRLTAEDIVHELLHVAHPDWDEDEVVRQTERLRRFVSRWVSYPCSATERPFRTAEASPGSPRTSRPPSAGSPPGSAPPMSAGRSRRRGTPSGGRPRGLPGPPAPRTGR